MPPPPPPPPPAAAPMPDVQTFLSSFIPNALQGNPYFEAGFGLSIVGTSLALARGSAKSMTNVFKRNFLVTMEITSKDRSYPWVLSLLTRQSLSSRSGSTLAQHVSVTTVIVGDTAAINGLGTSSQDNSGGLAATASDSVSFDFAPCPGRHFASYGGRFLMVERSRSEQVSYCVRCLYLTRCFINTRPLGNDGHADGSAL